jgi:hypothetical protein
VREAQHLPRHRTPDEDHFGEIFLTKLLLEAMRYVSKPFDHKMMNHMDRKSGSALKVFYAVREVADTQSPFFSKGKTRGLTQRAVGVR